MSDSSSVLLLGHLDLLNLSTGFKVLPQVLLTDGLRKALHHHTVPGGPRAYAGESNANPFGVPIRKRSQTSTWKRIHIHIYIISTVHKTVFCRHWKGNITMNIVYSICTISEVTVAGSKELLYFVPDMLFFWLPFPKPL